MQTLHNGGHVQDSQAGWLWCVFYDVMTISSIKWLHQMWTAESLSIVCMAQWMCHACFCPHWRSPRTLSPSGLPIQWQQKKQQGLVDIILKYAACSSLAPSCPYFESHCSRTSTMWKGSALYVCCVLFLSKDCLSVHVYVACRFFQKIAYQSNFRLANIQTLTSHDWLIDAVTNARTPPLRLLSLLRSGWYNR